MSETTPEQGPEFEREFEPAEGGGAEEYERGEVRAEEHRSEEYRASGPAHTPFETDPVDHAEQRVEVEFDEESRD
ncbi:MAG TPA: hypothetical protein GX743_08305 [Actinomycetales bacterium]|nr:hypothetical protein [Actinomycetales bacterium]